MGYNKSWDHEYGREAHLFKRSSAGRGIAEAKSGRVGTGAISAAYIIRGTSYGEENIEEMKGKMNNQFPVVGVITNQLIVPGTFRTPTRGGITTSSSGLPVPMKNSTR